MIVLLLLILEFAELYFSLSAIHAFTKLEVWSLSVVRYKKLLDGRFFQDLDFIFMVTVK